jgi:hypothetical protein
MRLAVADVLADDAGTVSGGVGHRRARRDVRGRQGRRRDTPELAGRGARSRGGGLSRRQRDGRRRSQAAEQADAHAGAVTEGGLTGSGPAQQPLLELVGGAQTGRHRSAGPGLAQADLGEIGRRQVGGVGVDQCAVAERGVGAAPGEELREGGLSGGGRDERCGHDQARDDTSDAGAGVQNTGVSLGGRALCVLMSGSARGQGTGGAGCRTDGSGRGDNSSYRRQRFNYPCLARTTRRVTDWTFLGVTKGTFSGAGARICSKQTPGPAPRWGAGPVSRPWRA